MIVDTLIIGSWGSIGQEFPLGTSKYSPEFKADAVALYYASPGGTYASVPKDVRINHEMLRTWVRGAEQAAGTGPVEATAMPCGGPRSTCGRDQLVSSRLRETPLRV
ncbi:transposase [Streptomyces sp. NPDC002659]|uniref:transposase n=1 Tax=Streptomyces sp. NPDC002659 TaxID=3364656 RepID=UPI0036A4D83E